MVIQYANFTPARLCRINLNPQTVVYAFGEERKSLTQTQNALLIAHKCGPFVIGTREIPTPGPGELLVKIHGAGLNPADWKIQAIERYGSLINDYPAVAGTDIAGAVEAFGEGVQGFQKDDRVVCSSKPLYRRLIPPNLTHAQAAAIPAAFICAAVSLLAPAPMGLGLTPPFDRKPHYSQDYSGPALVIGGSSSVGQQYAIQLLKLGGFAPIITYASEAHSAYIRKNPLCQFFKKFHKMWKITLSLQLLGIASQILTFTRHSLTFIKTSSK
ncbi:chaperonin 10-like protein [Mycena crocata]|nr:chaperonin 10-like protein [Mycena crocata]